jgi:hypothetical protein
MCKIQGRILKMKRFTLSDIKTRISIMDKILAEEDRRIFKELCKPLRKNKKCLAFTFYFGIM